jgi:hypothetical protein
MAPLYGRTLKTQGPSVSSNQLVEAVVAAAAVVVAAAAAVLPGHAQRTSCHLGMKNGETEMDGFILFENLIRLCIQHHPMSVEMTSQGTVQEPHKQTPSHGGPTLPFLDMP